MDYPSGPVGSPRRNPQPGNKPASHSFSAPAPSATSSVPMVVIVTVVGILSAFVLLASYCAFVTKCQLLRLLLSRARHGALGEAPPSSSSVIVRDGAASDEQRGLGLPLIRMLPVVEFTAAAQGRKKLSVSSECGVCLSEFEERERVRLLPACAHAFHVDCIDTWLQGSARCPFCRASVTLLPPLPPPQQQPSSPNLAAIGNGSDRDSIVVEVRGEQESWPGRAASGRKARKKKESVGDEAVDTRSRKEEEEFAVQPVRRSLSCGDRLCVSVVRELLAAGQSIPAASQNNARHL